MAKIIGIDLGTSNSSCAVLEGGRPVIVPSAEGVTAAGGKAFPSVIAFTKDGELIVGEPARRQAVSNPEGTVLAIKRKMGSSYKVHIRGKEYTPQQISAFLLQKIKRDAEAFLNETIDKAVITVPAYFNDNQRQATKDAGAIAGLDVVRIINEPTAASLAYGLDKSEADQKIMVFDLGGGTLDVTIMEFGGGVFEVQSTSGDTQLGGTDMDNLLVEYLANEFQQDQGIDLRQDQVAIQRLREAGEKAKIELSTVMSTEINLPYITADASGPKHLNMSLTRAQLEKIIQPIVDRCVGPIRQALTDAKITPNDIDTVILVGGPTRMPIIQKFVGTQVGDKIARGVDPMECVSIGAAIQAAVLAGEDLGRDLVLLDVTPLTLGVETLGGVMTSLIERNTTIPTRKSEIFTTAADMQTAVTVHVLQGERPMAKDNVSLGQFNLVGIPPAPRGIPQVDVTFDIDANGILNVSAKDLGTGKEQRITITASTKLSDDDKDRMVREAEEFAEQDRLNKEEVEARNAADSMIYTAEKTMKDLGARIEEAQRKRVDNAIAEVRDALFGSDIEKIKAETEKLGEVLQEVSAVVYQQAAQEQAQAGGQAGGAAPGYGSPPPGSEPHEASAQKDDKGKSDAVDADYRVVDDE